MPSWFMKRFSSVSARLSNKITQRTICYFARYTLIILIELFHSSLSVREPK